jgi:hypothetical protein
MKPWRGRRHMHASAARSRRSGEGSVRTGATPYPCRYETYTNFVLDSLSLTNRQVGYSRYDLSHWSHVTRNVTHLNAPSPQIPFDTLFFLCIELSTSALAKFIRVSQPQSLFHCGSVKRDNSFQIFHDASDEMSFKCSASPSQKSRR